MPPFETELLPLNNLRVDAPDLPPAQALLPDALPQAGDSNFPTRPQFIDIRSASLAIIAFIAIVFGLKYGKDALIPITLSIFLGYALMPSVSALKRYCRIPAPLGALIAMLILVGLVGLGAALVQPQVARLIDSLPRATYKLKAILHTTALDRNSAVRRLTIAADEIESAANASNAPGAAQPTSESQTSHINLRDYLWSAASALLGGIGQAVVVLALSTFLLISGQDFKRKLVRISGDSLREKKVTVRILDEIDQQIQRYLMLQIGTSALVGVLTGLSFAVIGLENALFWGTAAGILHMVPYVGPAVAISGAAIFAYVQFPDLRHVIYVVVSATAIVWTVGMVLLPVLTQRMASLNAPATFVSLVVWEWLWGIPGLLLGVPIMMALMAVCERIETLQPIAELLNSEKPKVVPAPIVELAA